MSDIERTVATGPGGVRERLEYLERVNLSPLAAQSAEATRQRAEEPSAMRTAFQRDRDRILHTKEFRRLKHKTQVFIAPHGDHYRTRLTHTLEVTQIARTVARALRLNEDLVEAIGLGHDVGHTPFGHSGERALARLLGNHFRHNEQSLRIVDLLANEYHGLNLTDPVREGIFRHSKSRQAITGMGWGTASTLEGQIIKIADSVAYINHDIDDAMRAGLLRDEDLPAAAVEVLGRTLGQRIDRMVTDLIEHNWWATGEDEPADPPTIMMSPDVLAASNALREFMFQRVYLNQATQEEEKVDFIIGSLFQYFLDHPDKLPTLMRTTSEARGESLERAVTDYIAGMTDRYAMSTFNALFMPSLETAPSSLL